MDWYEITEPEEIEEAILYYIGWATTRVYCVAGKNFYHAILGFQAERR